MFHVTTLGWAATLVALFALFTFDLRASIRGGAPSFRGSVWWSIFYVAVAAAFGLVFGLIAGWTPAGQYFAGYVVEKSLSVDNLFLFVVILGSFAVPAELQGEALTIGIVLALALRAVFIALGAALIAEFDFMFVIFGLILLISAVQLVRHRNDKPTAKDNRLVSLARRWLPITKGYDGGRVVTRVSGRRMFTPMLLVLLAIGTTDVLFALDSIPAVFGITQHAYIVFVANAFALLGLRALVALVAAMLDRIAYLTIGLSVILSLIGVKLILHYLHDQHDSVPEISTGLSLGLIALILGVTALVSVIRPRSPRLRPDERPGSEA